MNPRCGPVFKSFTWIWSPTSNPCWPRIRRLLGCDIDLEFIEAGIAVLFARGYLGGAGRSSLDRDGSLVLARRVFDRGDTGSRRLANTSTSTAMSTTI